MSFLGLLVSNYLYPRPASRWLLSGRPGCTDGALVGIALTGVSTLSPGTAVRLWPHTGRSWAVTTPRRRSGVLPARLCFHGCDIVPFEEPLDRPVRLGEGVAWTTRRIRLTGASTSSPRRSFAVKLELRYSSAGPFAQQSTGSTFHVPMYPCPVTAYRRWQRFSLRFSVAVVRNSRLFQMYVMSVCNICL